VTPVHRRRRGGRGESAPGLACLAVPIFSNDRVIGAISLQGPRAIVDHGGEQRLVDLLHQAADKITNRISRIRIRIRIREILPD